MSSALATAFIFSPRRFNTTALSGLIATPEVSFIIGGVGWVGGVEGEGVDGDDGGSVCSK